MVRVRDGQKDRDLCAVVSPFPALPYLISKE